MQLAKNIVLTLLLLLFCACSQKEISNLKDSQAIYTYLYNQESALPFPPPSLEMIKNGAFKKIKGHGAYIDSVKYAVAKNCVPDPINPPIFKGIPADFDKLIEDFNTSKGVCLIHKIKWRDQKGDQIPLVTDNFSKVALQGVKDKYKVLGIVSYTPVVFNEAHTKALVCFGAIREGLDAHWGAYFFEKKNGKWQIITQRTLSSS